MVLIIALISLFTPGFASSMGDRLATRLPEMGNHHSVTTTSAEAQKFFNQSLTRLYAFNQDEAARSVKRALEFDSALATAITQ